MSTFHNPLQSISLFVLLDLLGAANPKIPSYFLTTHWAYKNMAEIERRMRDLGLLEAKLAASGGNTKGGAAFLPDAKKQPQSFGRGFVEDDHIPFMRRGVDILHMIPSPFPDVWHTMMDDGEHLDLPTTRDWAKIVTAFTVEWMDIKDHMPKRAVAGVKRSETSGGSVSRKTEL
jgi:glutaminyl-peptide cyclotransferase